MKHQPTHFTPLDSLDVITAMIRQAQGNVKHNSAYFLLWGWVVTLADLGMYVLHTIGYSHPYIVWLITIPAWIYTLYKAFRRSKTSVNTTHLDKISAALWMAFAIVVFTLVAFGYKINYQINPIILIVSSLPTFVSGLILKFKPLMIGGVLFWIGGIINFNVPFNVQPLIGALTIICGYLIPGYMLKNQKTSDV